MGRLLGQMMLLLLLLTGLCCALNVYAVLPWVLLEKCWLLLLPLTSLGGGLLYGRARLRLGGGVWVAVLFCLPLMLLGTMASGTLAVSVTDVRAWLLIVLAALIGEALGRSRCPARTAGSAEVATIGTDPIFPRLGRRQGKKKKISDKTPDNVI